MDINIKNVEALAQLLELNNVDIPLLEEELKKYQEEYEKKTVLLHLAKTAMKDYESEISLAREKLQKRLDALGATLEIEKVEEYSYFVSYKLYDEKFDVGFS